MADHRQMRTQYSGQALALADRFTLRFAATKIAPGDYFPQMTAPDGPSTGGGVQALQHLRLVSRNPSLPAILVGTVNQKTSVAELRTLDYVAAQYKMRFKQDLVLDQAAYEAFLKQAQDFLNDARMLTSIVKPPSDLSAMGASSPATSPRSVAPPAQRSNTTALVILMLALLAAGGLAALFVLRR